MFSFFFWLFVSFKSQRLKVSGSCYRTNYDKTNIVFFHFFCQKHGRLTVRAGKVT